VNISAKNAARIKLKDSFVIYIKGAYQKYLNFYCSSSGSDEINKKQSGKSFAGHPVHSLYGYFISSCIAY
jgi:hypothetical protein